MRQHRTANAFIIAFALVLGVSTLQWTASTTGRDGDDAANIIAADGSATGASDAATPKKKGNRFARFFKAPFKAVGNLFSHDDDNNGGAGKMARMTERDAARFESSPLLRVDDSRSAAKMTGDDTGDAHDYLRRGREAFDGGRLNDAITQLSRAVALDARLREARTLLAQAYDRKGLHDRARATYETALDDQPNDAQALNNLGYSLYLNGNYRAALDRLKRAAKLAPADERILNNLALAQCRLGKFGDAYKNFARANGELTGHLNVAALLERTGRNDDAVIHYEAARRLQPKSEVALRRLADLYTRAGHTEQAAQAQRDLNGTTGEMIAAKGN